MCLGVCESIVRIPIANMGAFIQPTWKNICTKAVQRHVRESIVASEAVEENLQVWNRDGRPGGLIQPLATLKGTNVVIIPFFFIYLTKRCNFMVRATIWRSFNLLKQSKMRMLVCLYHCSRLVARLSGSVPSWGQCRPPVQQAVEASITQALQARVTQCKTPTFLQNNVVLKLETFQTNYSFTVAFYNFTDEYSWRWWIIYGQVLGAIWELDVRDSTALGM